MSSCLSGGGRLYRFELEIAKSPSTSTRTSQTSSPSSTLSESSNSPLGISTRKPRTPRKRPNQTYNEAAALLSTAYPNIFSTKHLTKTPQKFTKPVESLFDESSNLLLPFRVFDDSGFLLHQPTQDKPSFPFAPKIANFCDKSSQSSGEVDFHGNSGELCDGYQEDFDAESILDEEIEEGIDSIMGNLSVSNDPMADESSGHVSPHGGQTSSWYGKPMVLGFGGKFESGFGFSRGLKALRNVDEGNWWDFPIVDVLQISPKFNNSSSNGGGGKSTNNNKLSNSAQKKKKKVEKPVAGPKNPELAKENSIPKPNTGLQLRLNYDEVLNAWSDRGSPFSEETSGYETPGNDVYARLAQIDLFSDGGGGVREASVLRYKEKRHTRLFSKKIRYQVRKVNADRRPRMKGRFVRRQSITQLVIRDHKKGKKTIKELLEL